MRVSRNSSIRWQRFLDAWIPPAIRDSRWFMSLPMFVIFRSGAREMMRFKETAFELDQPGLRDVYRRLASANVHGETALNEACIDRVLSTAVGPSVLEVGTGTGFLATRLAERHVVTAVDLVASPEWHHGVSNLWFQEANVESLPFGDDTFHTVVCTHTLEHVQKLHLAMTELRRVAARRLIVVVPRQRPYRYTFGLHVNFFPYAWSLTGQLGHRRGSVLEDLGDWFYQEDDPVP